MICRIFRSAPFSKTRRWLMQWAISVEWSRKCLSIPRLINRMFIALSSWMEVRRRKSMSTVIFQLCKWCLLSLPQKMVSKFGWACLRKLMLKTWVITANLTDGKNLTSPFRLCVIYLVLHLSTMMIQRAISLISQKILHWIISSLEFAPRMVVILRRTVLIQYCRALRSRDNSS